MSDALLQRQQPRGQADRTGVLIVEARQHLARLVTQGLHPSGSSARWYEPPGAAAAAPLAAALAEQPPHTLVLSPLRPHRGRLQADVDFAQQTLRAARQARVQRLVLVSSAEIYGAAHYNPGLCGETEAVVRKRANQVAQRWSDVEQRAVELFGGEDPPRLTILRPCWTLVPEARDWPGRLFRRRLAVPVAGHNPALQLLAAEDLAAAVVAAVTQRRGGIFNVAPDGAVPLRTALRLARVWSLPLPYLWQTAARKLMARLGLAETIDQVEFLRYIWTVSGENIDRQLGFRPRYSSARAALRFAHGDAAVDEAADSPPPPPARSADQGPAYRPPAADPAAGRLVAAAPRRQLPAAAARRYDDFGMDADYIRSCARWQIGFMEKCYWRVNVYGMEHIPASGPAVLAGIHRGFMPFDGVMLVHLMSKYAGRIPRFLMHATLLKFPHLAGFLSRYGGIMACQQNVDRVLGDGEILGIFPEGIRGAFRKYNREVYHVGKFGRDDFARMALQHGVPIIPFVTVGTAEIFPILGKVEWSWLKRYTEWPFLPITPTFPLLPVPLPTKWHVQFLPPITASGAVDDRRSVRRLSRQVRGAMQEAIDDMLQRRRWIFFGSLAERPRDVPVSDSPPPRNEQVQIEAEVK